VALLLGALGIRVGEDRGLARDRAGARRETASSWISCCRTSAQLRLPVGSSSIAACLTPREREIVGLVAQGMTNAEVARILWNLSGTVRKHLENASEKLGIRTRAGAVAALLRQA
jgi:DNA-binding CsgD family transcriptional regulator